MGMGATLLDAFVDGTAAAAPAGSPAANALVGSATPNRTPSVSTPSRTVLPVGVADSITTPAPGSSYPLGLTGTQWLMILGAAAVLAYFLMHKGGRK